MKKINLLLVSLTTFLALNSTAYSQNNAPLEKIKIYAGFGFQQYSGDLGNGFFNSNNVMYGVASIGVDYKLNNSFGVKILSTLGDLGYCQEREIILSRIPLEIGHDGHHSDENITHYAPEEENLMSRLVTGTIAVQYYFANGKILPLESKFQPSVYLGFGINNLTDIKKMECVQVGQYFSTNMGMSLSYQISNRLSFGYNLGLGIFTDDKIDFISKGANDMYMQNSAVLAIGF